MSFPFSVRLSERLSAKKFFSSKIAQIRKFGEQTSRILEFKPEVTTVHFRESEYLINLHAKKVLEVGIMNEVCAAILVSVRNIKACLEKKLCSCCFLTSQLGGHWTSLTSPRYVSRIFEYHKSLSNN